MAKYIAHLAGGPSGAGGSSGDRGADPGAATSNTPDPQSSFANDDSAQDAASDTQSDSDIEMADALSNLGDPPSVTGDYSAPANPEQKERGDILEQVPNLFR